MQSNIVSGPLDLAKVNFEFQQGISGAGALVTFAGFVRDFNLEGDIQGLELEHYPGMTEKALESLALSTQERFKCIAVQIVHRVGKIENHEPIVWVGAASSHRQAAFDATMYAMDILKRDVPLWKKEWHNGEANWVEAKRSDAKSAQRWSK